RDHSRRRSRVARGPKLRTSSSTSSRVLSASVSAAAWARSASNRACLRPTHQGKRRAAIRPTAATREARRLNMRQLGVLALALPDNPPSDSCEAHTPADEHFNQLTGNDALAHQITGGELQDDANELLDGIPHRLLLS